MNSVLKFFIDLFLVTHFGNTWNFIIELKFFNKIWYIGEILGGNIIHGVILQLVPAKSGRGE